MDCTVWTPENVALAVIGVMGVAWRGCCLNRGARVMTIEYKTVYIASDGIEHSSPQEISDE